MTYNGQPIPFGIVMLFNHQTGIGASAALDASGTYRIESVQPGDYQVAIGPEPLDPATIEAVHLGKLPRETMVQPPQLNIPAKYQNTETSGVTVTVKEGTNTADLNL